MSKPGDVVQIVNIEPSPDAPINWSRFPNETANGVKVLSGPVQVYEAPWPPKPDPAELENTIWTIE